MLIVSAQGEEIYKIKGLNLGADDYITKPFGMGELVARVNSHLKIYERLKNKQEKKDTSEVRGLKIDKSDRRVFVDGEEKILKQKEFDLLLFLAMNPNRVFGKEMLFERVWGYDALSDASTVTVHIARILSLIHISSVEFVVGCLVNKVFHLNVWDYSRQRFNLGGQICLLYSVLWFFLCIPLTYLCKQLSKRETSGAG